MQAFANADAALKFFPKAKWATPPKQNVSSQAPHSHKGAQEEQKSALKVVHQVSALHPAAPHSPTGKVDETAPAATAHKATALNHKHVNTQQPGDSDVKVHQQGMQQEAPTAYDATDVSSEGAIQMQHGMQAATMPDSTAPAAVAKQTEQTVTSCLPNTFLVEPRLVTALPADDNSAGLVTGDMDVQHGPPDSTHLVTSTPSAAADTTDARASQEDPHSSYDADATTNHHQQHEGQTSQPIEQPTLSPLLSLNNGGNAVDSTSALQAHNALHSLPAVQEAAVADQTELVPVNASSAVRASSAQPQCHKLKSFTWYRHGRSWKRRRKF